MYICVFSFLLDGMANKQADEQTGDGRTFRRTNGQAGTRSKGKARSDGWSN